MPVKSNAQQHTSLTVRSTVTLASYPHWSFPKISALFPSDIPIQMQYTFLFSLKHTRRIFPKCMLSFYPFPDKAALPHRKPVSAGTSHETCRVHTTKQVLCSTSNIFQEHKFQVFHFVIFSTLAILHPFQFQLPQSPQLLIAFNTHLLKTWEKYKFGVFFHIL